MGRAKIEINLNQVEELARRGLTEEQISDALGISRTTLTVRKRENAQFAQAIKRGKANGIADVSNRLMLAVESGNVTAMIFFLKTRAGWSERIELPNEAGLIPASVQVTVIDSGLTEAEVDAGASNS